MRTVVIHADELTADLWCPSCTTLRRVRQPQPGYWAYCVTCGSLLVDPATRRRYAGFWRRFAGYWIDYGAVLALEIPIVVTATWWITDSATALFMALIFGGVVDFLYKWMGNARGATLGKAALGLRIIDVAGRPPGLKRSLTRYFMSLVSGIGVAFGYFAMLAHRDKQTWHDSAAGTYVVKR
jgi:uncharacterized RDD family membrane protein YckC